MSQVQVSWLLFLLAFLCWVVYYRFIESREVVRFQKRGEKEMGEDKSVRVYEVKTAFGIMLVPEEETAEAWVEQAAQLMVEKCMLARLVNKEHFEDVIDEVEEMSGRAMDPFYVSKYEIMEDFRESVERIIKEENAEE